ncbi:HlyD family efflux transporter periplasmic adaptor subunit [Rhodopirellula sp. JC740]|uniref:HlyD family efflux transporter periplasmic adaptor subunit n=1 Tax=Rhodopirellula halodulae TaxID=2894198 RepID=A0ABS8NI96_9BACT|nr:HlyD family efflux transporter periplasmic adaptor subunit [Rhodopirellula sp. JC740]MCC9643285.1 HlyD family efflux transporter periplasmic adaptor subunit [Rhodopirellula sp. JC740]
MSIFAKTRSTNRWFTSLVSAALFGTCLLATPLVAQELLPPGTPETQSSADVSIAAFEIPSAQAILISDVTLSAPIAGRVASVLVEEGSVVRPRKLLVQLDDSRAKAELNAAKAAERAAELQSNSDVDRRYAERTLEVRVRELEQSLLANESFEGSVTATEIDRLKLVIDQAELSIEQAERERKMLEAQLGEKQSLVELAELRMREHRVESSLDGRVAELSITEGQWVEAGAPLVRLISLNPIRISGFVNGRQHGQELVGRKVEFELDAAKGSTEATVLRGEVSFVSDELNPVNGQVRMWADLKNPEQHVRPGMRGTLRVLASDKENALQEQK